MSTDTASYRPDTASAIRAVMQSEGASDSEYNFGQSRGAGNGDFRPDTAAALRAVEQQYDARPDTAAAIAAVMQSEANSGVAGYGGRSGGYDEKYGAS